ncbi:Arc40p SCDLUD_001017 [Saccharomycodes ludwigii]|uniref:Arc40p n=1 Tax=Saccharomycodes ludwigii TaxID=36035 RepID=UPI001E827D5E|nr:hypothetical protein SCDLUD_001017 [Saccharomycodes ludwigii]KAH3903384.1 hypothetical protein SCDLUD_001017 [Saccharomycodes ludwigii]
MSKDVVNVLKLVKTPIYSHAYSQDKSILAITSETNCLLYNITNPKSPKLVATLADHDKTVTAVDISIHGRIVTCSQDRNAIVWEPLSDGTYKPTLVLLRINRAATCVKWAPNGFKFACGSSARVVAVCYYEQENNWWVSKHIKSNIRSTITCLTWHDNGVVLACGGTEGLVNVYSGFIKGLDKKEQVVNSPWGAGKFPFGLLLKQFYQGSWIRGVAFNGGLELLAFVSHDARLTVVDVQGNTQAVENPCGLPFNDLLWLGDNRIICAGYNCHPVEFDNLGGGTWKFKKNIDKVSSTGKNNLTNSFDNATDDDDSQPSFGISALKKFKQLDLKGKVTAVDNELGTTHQNAITQLRLLSANQVSSSGLDGIIVVFNV